MTLLEFRKNAQRILQRMRDGESVVMTVRGKPVARLEPIDACTQPKPDDSFYRLAEKGPAYEGPSLTNRQIDDIVYGN